MSSFDPLWFCKVCHEVLHYREHEDHPGLCDKHEAYDWQEDYETYPPNWGEENVNEAWLFIHTHIIPEMLPK